MNVFEVLAQGAILSAVQRDRDEEEAWAEQNRRVADLLPRPDVAVESTDPSGFGDSGVRARLEDCTSAVGERLKASLARGRLRHQLPFLQLSSTVNADLWTLLAEVDDLNRRLRDATHAMQKAVSAIDNEQYHARVRAAKSHLQNELEGLVHEFGIEG